MLRWAGQKFALSAGDAPGRRAGRAAVTGPFLRGLGTFDRQTAATALGLCGWMLAGGTALFAFWELGGFSVLLSNDPFRPAEILQSAPPSTFHPAGEGEAGCTQAPIDRSSGQTIPADCHTMAPGARLLAA